MDPSTGKPQPRDDEPIERAFLALDAKLAIWAEAATQLSAHLASAAAELAEKSNELGQTTVEPDAPCESPQEVDLATEPASQAEEPIAEPAEPPDVVDEAPEEVTETLDPQAPDVDSEEPASDEDLLAALEPELANKIRVIRRLNPNRDVREMIEHYQAQRDTETTDPSKKQSWWKRKKQ